MLDFLIPKNKVRAYSIREIPIEHFEVIGIGQINPYCNLKYDNELFLTVINIAGDCKKYDEKEGIILSKQFTVRKCPECGALALVPTKIRINLKNQEAPNQFEETIYNFPSYANAYCNSCSTCFEIRIKSSDLWVKEAKKVKEKELIGGLWEEYQVG